MLSKARIGSHPLHPMLIALPITSYVATFVSLIAYAMTGDPFWFRLALWANLAGVVTAILAAIPGTVDYLTVVPRRTVAKRTGAVHAIANVAALALFAINLFLLYDVYGDYEALSLAGPLILTGAGVLLTMIAGFFGWEMVQRHHVGVLDRPDTMAVNDPDAVAARWMESQPQPVTESQVISSQEAARRSGRQPPVEDDATTGRWPRDGGESGRITRH